jgi:hypothetical protein
VRFSPLVAPQELYGPPAIAEFAEHAGYDRIFVEGFPFLSRRLGTIHRFFAVPDYEPLLPGRYLRFFAVPPGKVWHGQLALERGNARFPAQPAERLDLLSVRYYVAGEDVSEAIGGRVVVRGTHPILERSRALPRAYLVHDVVRAATESEALEAVREGRFDPRGQAVVSGDPGLEPAVPGAPEHAQITAYRPTRVELEAACASSCLLVLTDVFDPHWRATVDGEPAEVLAANYLFRGVRLSAGRHRIVFAYRPRALHLGAAISAATSLVVTGLLVGPALRRARA